MIHIINEQYLATLGFVDFIHLDKTKRDLKRRMIANKMIEGDWLTILIVQENQVWVVEKLIFEGENKVIRKYLPVNPSLEEVIKKLFIES